MQTTQERLEIQPRVGRNVSFMILGCAAFTIIGIWMIISGENIFAGLLSVIFFGGGGIYAIPKLIQRKVSLVLIPEGIEQQYAQGQTFIPWSDVEDLGIVTIYSNKMVGIRLQSYDRYLNNMTPDLAEFMTKSLPVMKLMARATSLLDAPAAVTLWSKLKGDDPQKALESFGKVGNLVESLMWARETYGYDLLLTWAEMDRSAAKFLELLESYRD